MAASASAAQDTGQRGACGMADLIIGQRLGKAVSRGLERRRAMALGGTPAGKSRDGAEGTWRNESRGAAVGKHMSIEISSEWVLTSRRLAGARRVSRGSNLNAGQSTL